MNVQKQLLFKIMPPRRYRRYGGKDPIDGALSSPFNIFNPHDEPSPLYNNDSIIIVSVDPGIKNCGVYIQKVNLLNDERKSMYLARMQFDQTDNHYIASIKKFEELEKKANVLSKAHYIVVEKQMVLSTPNTRMGQHLITFFLTFLRNKGNRPIIVEIASTAKTRILKCPKGMKKPEYKKWCHTKAVLLLESRDTEHEEKYINLLTGIKKKDDVGDAVCQSEAFIQLQKMDIYPYPKPIKRKLT